MYPILKERIAEILLTQLTDERKAILQELIFYISLKRKEKKTINLNFICTHNSRRSHLSQIWAQTAAAYYTVKDVYCYSGGTEATAMYSCIRETLLEQGFSMTQLSPEPNPLYAIKSSESSAPIWAFSKKYDSPTNPASHYAAVMTCSHADQNCPIVTGADTRIPVMYLDPKAFDESPLQKQKYMEKSMEIAAEMFYVMREVQ